MEPDILRTIAPKRIIRTVKQKSRRILQYLRDCGDAALMDILKDCEDKSDLITAFLSVLELCSMGSILIEGEAGDYLLHFTGGDVEEIVDSISSESDQ